MGSEDIRDFLTDLSAAGVEFLIVGAYALAAHGRVRATGDIDVLVRPTSANARRLEKAVEAFAGVSLEYFGVSVPELSRPKVGFYMGVEPDRIDVLTKIAGVSFDRAWKARIKSEIEGVPVAILGYRELVDAKRASRDRRDAGSAKQAQDEADLRWLLAHRPQAPKKRRRRRG